MYSFTANEWKNAMGLRGIESEGIWRRGKRYWMRGNARSFTANKQMQGVLEQTSEGTQWVWGESNAKGYGGRTLLRRGNARSFTANRQMWGVLGKPRRSFEHPWAYKYAKKPTWITHQALLSDQGFNIVVVFKIIVIFIKKNVQFKHELWKHEKNISLKPYLLKSPI